MAQSAIYQHKKKSFKLAKKIYSKKLKKGKGKKTIKQHKAINKNIYKMIIFQSTCHGACLEKQIGKTRNREEGLIGKRKLILKKFFHNLLINYRNINRKALIFPKHLKNDE